MSDFSESDDQYDEEPRGLRKQIEDQAVARKAAEAEAAALKRELAFAKAGLDLSDPKIGYFTRGYDGEPDPEKIRAAALEAGFIGSTQDAGLTTELAQHQAATNLASGSTLNETWAGAYYDNPQYQAEVRTARTPDEVLARVRAAGGLVQDDLDY